MAQGGEAHPCQCHIDQWLEDNKELMQDLANDAYREPAVQSGHVGELGMAHYSDGGSVAPDFIPDAAGAPQAAPDFIPDTAATAPDFIPDSGESDPNSAYHTSNQKLLTSAEGAARGIAGPLATAAETGLSKLGVPGISPEEQKARTEANPVQAYGSEAAAFAGSMYFGVGEAHLLAKVGAEAAEAANLGKVGSAVLKGAVESGIFQYGDEVSNYLMGKQVHPENVVAAGIVGGALGPVLGLVSKGGSDAKVALEGIEDGKIQSKVDSFMHGFGAAAKGLSPEEAVNSSKIPLDSVRRGASVLPPANLPNDAQAIKWGHNAFQMWQKKLPQLVAEGAVGVAGHATGTGTVGALALEHLIGRPVSKMMTKANAKYITPALMKALASGDTQGITQTLRYARAVGKGAASIASSVNGLFSSAVTPVINAAVDENDREKLSKSIEEGDLTAQLQTSAQGYAKGGIVTEPQPPVLAHSDGVTKHYPEQAMMLGAAKGRVASYLNSIRPPKTQPKLPYDQDMSHAPKDRHYKAALDLAIRPLAILNKVKDGSISAEDVGHFKSLYPEMHEALSKHITDKMVNQQLKEERPSYAMRQGLATFLGSPTDSCMTQPFIAAAQTTFVQQRANAPRPTPAKPEKKNAALDKAPGQYKTGDQAAQFRASR